MPFDFGILKKFFHIREGFGGIVKDFDHSQLEIPSEHIVLTVYYVANLCVPDFVGAAGPGFPGRESQGMYCNIGRQLGFISRYSAGNRQFSRTGPGIKLESHFGKYSHCPPRTQAAADNTPHARPRSFSGKPAQACTQ